MHLVTRGHFRSCDKDGGHTIRLAMAEKPMLHANFTALCVIETKLLLIAVLHCGNSDFRPFAPVSLNLTWWPSYTHLIHILWKRIGWANELSMSRLSKVIVWHTCIHTYIQCESKKVAPKPFCDIFTQVKCISVKFCQHVVSSYLHITTNFGRFILIFNKIPLIFLGVPIVFNVFSFKFHQVKSP